MNRVPVTDGLVTIAADETGHGAMNFENVTDWNIPLDVPLILEEAEGDRLIIVENVQGSPPVALFHQSASY